MPTKNNFGIQIDPQILTACRQRNWKEKCEDGRLEKDWGEEIERIDKSSSFINLRWKMRCQVERFLIVW